MFISDADEEMVYKNQIVNTCFPYDFMHLKLIG